LLIGNSAGAINTLAKFATVPRSAGVLVSRLARRG
jgi:hypothetical protein